MSDFNAPFSKIFHNILVIDIETVAMTASYEELPEAMQAQWQKKSQTLRKYNAELGNDAESFKERAGIYAEFAKIVCIAVGRFVQQGEQQYLLRVKSYAGDDEQLLLQDFFKDLAKFEKQGNVVFCGHNIKEFDLPFICRRSLLHGLKFPSSLQLTQVKSWNHPHIDTLELWRFGDYKHYISLDLLATIMGITSSKDEMDGSMVSHAYWQENNLEGIVRYCKKDVATTALVFQKMKGDTSIVNIEMLP